jgi:uncharacterized membrane protein
VAAAFVLRLLAARGDLWLDEIWSMELARIGGSVGGILGSVHHDNNHHLNTIWLLVVGPDAGPVAARLLSVVSGTVMVAVAIFATARRDRTTALLWGGLLAFSYFAVHYGSEARGYALAMLLAVACFALLERVLEGRGTAWAVAFAACAALGLLSHLTFLYALLAFLAWGAFVATRRSLRSPLAASLAVALVPPLATFGTLWLVDLRHLAVGGGPAYRLLDVLRELIRTSFGIPGGPLEIFGLLALGLCLAGFVDVARRGDASWVFAVTVTILGPAVALAVLRPAFLAPRYFAIAVPFLLWLAALGLVGVARWKPAGRLASGVLVALFLAGNAALLARLLLDGRGRYSEALEFIARSSRTVTTVGSDNDFRNGVVFDHHRPSGAGVARLEYVPDGHWTTFQPAWVLVHRFAGDPVPDPVVVGPTGRRYVLARTFPYAGLSGWEWYVYRMEAAAVAP